MIGINTFLTWVDIFRAAHARRPYHLVTYLHQLTIPSSGLVSPQDSSLHRLAWLALAAAGTPAVCAIQMHLLLMVSSISGLENVLGHGCHAASGPLYHTLEVSLGSPL